YGSGHDSAAAIAEDGTIVFALAEERLSRTKHDGTFPLRAIKACLAHVGAETSDLDDVAFGWQPPSAARRADLKSYLSGAYPLPFNGLLRSMSVGLIDEFRSSGERLFHRYFGVPKKGIRRVDHHLAHAISAYSVSGFDEATVVVIDGRGAWEATSTW